MRIFQNYGLYPGYRLRLAQLRRGARGFGELRSRLLEDRYNATHFLKPCDEGDPAAFITAGDDEPLQRAWAAEQGMPAGVTPSEILLAQIEHHRAEIFYNLDPMRFGNALLKQLPGCVRRTIAWRAAPSRGGDFLNHDIIVNNFPSLLAQYRLEGASTHYFTPSHDPVMDADAKREDRPVDVLFAGSYSQYHRKRARALERISARNGHYQVRFHLERSRLARLADTPVGLIGGLRRHRRPAAVREVSHSPVFGRALYHAIGGAKVVINSAIDMAGSDRGNMRLWEAMGCGAALVSDAGTYPPGIADGDSVCLYRSEDELVEKVEFLLNNPSVRKRMAERAFEIVSTRYSRTAQWRAFQELVR